MRLVSQQLNAAIEGNRTAPVNFGLYFNKMLPYHDGFTYLDMERKNGQENQKGIKESFKPCEGEINGKRFRDEQYGPFRQHHSIYVRSKSSADEILKQRHLHQAAYCWAMEQAGWRAFIIHARLTSPFVSGLGMAHPTETGLVLDHTSGMPYIPASSQKGVLRLTHLINTLCDEQGNWLPENELERQGLVQHDKYGELEWREDTASKTIFGFSEKNDSLAGQLTLLDAYPLSPPELGEEILNPHYKDYYGGIRGPTEDQSPIPVKFLVVKPGAEFVFRLLLRRPFAKATEQDQERLVHLVEKSLTRAITEEGMGAKTAIGFGRFKIMAPREPGKITTWLNEEDARKHPWRILAQKIEAAADWGQLKQLLDNQDLQTHQGQKEIADAVQHKAESIRKAKPEKWGEDRDKLLTAWLAPAGLTWHPLANSSPTAPTAVAQTGLSAEELAIIEKIEKLADWGVWKNSGISMDTLSKPALKKLQKKFASWKIQNGKGDKPTTWKRMNQLLRQP